MFDQRSTVLRHSMDERRNVSDARCSRCMTRGVRKRVYPAYQEASLDDANAGGLLDLTASFLSLREKWTVETIKQKTKTAV